MTTALADFHPTVRRWFGEKFPEPTLVQRAAWPVIADGGHTLITAPTGSGKTLTAFLWSLNRFARGDWAPGQTRVLYISPLKALNNDIQRNLLGPLAELQQSDDFPRLQVRTRSGDTLQSDRQRMLRKPPDILITTPESLTNLLTTVRGRTALQTIETIIFDEVHSLVDNRRGVSLLSSTERLVDLCGEIQRIALSATVNPLQAVATFVGGYDDTGTPRPVAIVNPPSDKSISLKVCYPESVQSAAESGDSVWDPLADHFRTVIDANRSTLFFTNSRMMAEKITLKINSQSPALLAYAHHGSLAREIRAEVERRLKDGELRAIVATSSLEMGIDIGALDLVVMLQAPPGIAATLQRLGRAGHSVGAVSHGALFPVHSHDFLQAAALSRATQQRDLEPLVPITGPLDTLAQIIISMTATESWQVDDIYQLIVRATPYHNLPREQFDLVLELLAGRYAGARVRELQPRIIYDRINATVTAKKGAVFALYNSGGSIPDRGYYQIRHADSGSKIGELDEEFVWEAKIGDSFTLGTQHWQVQRITHNDVMVRPAKPSGIAPPFWRAERLNRSFHYSQRIGDFLRLAETALDSNREDELVSHICSELAFDDSASKKLIDYLQRQRAATETALPHDKHLLVEQVATGPGGYRGPDMQQQVIIHTFWGGRLNQPWALAMQSAWQLQFNESPEIHADNDAIVIQTTASPDPAAVLALVNRDNIDELLRQSLEGSGFFGARFRECAGRFLLLPRQKFNQRLPLWMSRLQAKKLLAATQNFNDFPVTLEAWRSCLKDEFELDALRTVLTDLADGQIDWSFTQTASPSPFAGNLSFDQINRYMYADDTPEQSGTTALSDDLIKSAVQDASLRPRVAKTICDQFVAKRQRMLPEYQPVDAEEWSEWVKERVLIPASEWWPDWNDSPAKSDARLVEFMRGEERWVCHLEHAGALIKTGLTAEARCTHSEWPDLADERDAIALATEILSFYGPVDEPTLEKILPSVPAGLLQSEALIHGPLLEQDDTLYYCDAENFEILLRWQRAARRPSFEALPVTCLPAVIANWHHFNASATDTNLQNAFEQLRGFSSPVGLLLNDIFASRFRDFSTHQLDSFFQSQELAWFGTGNQQCCLCYPEDIELLNTPDDEAPIRSLFHDPNARYSYSTLSAELPADPSDNPAKQWWAAVWAGQIFADTLAPLRQGLERDYGNTGTAQPLRRSSRRRLSPRAVGWAGNWQLAPLANADADPLTEMEETRERVHLLLDRYGFINKELADREGGKFRWRHLFRALRVMELSGEVLQGLFFEQLAGPQFISQRALLRLQQQENPPDHFWCSALDPASPCGLGIDWPELPQRRTQNYLAFFQGELALVVENTGRRLTFHVPPDHPDISQILAVCEHLANTRKKIQVDSINAEPSRLSPYLPALARVLKKRADHKTVYFEP